MLPDSMYEYRYERDGGTLSCYICDNEIEEGNYYFELNDKTYCYRCVYDSKHMAGVD